MPLHKSIAGGLPGAGRLAAGLLAAAAAPLAVLAPREDPLRRFAIGGSEFGHFIALVGLAAALPGGRTPAARLGALLGLPAAALALTPLLRARLVDEELPGRLAAAFGDVMPRSRPGAPARPRPLVPAELFRGVRTRPIPLRSTIYSSPDGLDLRLDLYLPPGPGEPPPCVIMVHGGAWQHGNSRQLPALNHYLAARGYAVAAINYRLAPRHTFPAARDDVLAAVDYVRRNASELGVDGDRLALIGRSAGAHLVLLAAYAFPDPSIRGVAAFYAPVDLRAAVVDPHDPSKINEDGLIAQFLGGGLSRIPRVYEDATPLNFVGPSTPPTLLIHGGRDRLVWDRHSAVLARRLARAGRPHFYLNLPWGGHACDFFFSGPSGQISTYAVERFLAAVTR